VVALLVGRGDVRQGAGEALGVVEDGGDLVLALAHAVVDARAHLLDVLHDLTDGPLRAGHHLVQLAGDVLHVGGDLRHRVEQLRHAGRLERALHLTLLLGQVAQGAGPLRAGHEVEQGVGEERRGEALREAGVGADVDVALHPHVEAGAELVERDALHLAHLDAGDLDPALPGEPGRVLVIRVDEVGVLLRVAALPEEGERDQEGNPAHGDEEPDGEGLVELRSSHRGRGYCFSNHKER
jgi:hypothetical protein